MKTVFSPNSNLMARCTCNKLKIGARLLMKQLKVDAVKN